jgi:hypothetical protein
MKHCRHKTGGNREEETLGRHRIDGGAWLLETIHMKAETLKEVEDDDDDL